MAVKNTKGETMNAIKGDPNCTHCLGVGSFGGVLFGGPQDCYCVLPVPCSRCEGNGKEPYNRSGKLYCFTCNGSGEEPKIPLKAPERVI